MYQPSLAPSLVLTTAGSAAFMWAVLHPGSSIAVMVFWVGLVLALLGTRMLMSACNTNTTTH